jgi:type IV pilus assembly protein PilN
MQQQLMLMGAAAVGSLVLALGVHQFVRSGVDRANERVAALNTQLAQFKPQQEQVEGFKNKKSEIEQKLEVIQRLERSRSGPVHILDELASRTPERVWLTSLMATGGKIELEGMSLDNELVALFLTALNDSAYFANVELKTTELKTVDSLKLNTFRIVAQLESPDAPASANTPAPETRGKKGAKPTAARAAKPAAGKES